MKNYFITFRSVTPAQRGERLLKNNGFRCVLRRTPKWLEEQGCGYCIQLLSGEIGEAAAILRQGELPMRRVFVQQGDGTLEELAV